MSKVNDDWYNLPPLQKRIILFLAENGAETRNEVHKKVKSGYKNVLFSFNSLEEKGLVHVVSQKFYRQQRFPEFWLTDKGLTVAILNDSDSTLLLNNVKKIYPEDKEKALLVELSRVVPKELFMVASSLMNITKVDITTILGLTVTASQGLGNKDASTLSRKLNMVLKKYPKYQRMARKGFKKARKQLKELEDLF